MRHRTAAGGDAQGSGLPFLMAGAVGIDLNNPTTWVPYAENGAHPTSADPADNTIVVTARRVKYETDGDVHYVIFPDGADIQPYVRGDKDTLLKFGRRLLSSGEGDIFINANNFDVSFLGRAGVLFDEIDVSETPIVGDVVVDGQDVGGRASDFGFYVSENMDQDEIITGMEFGQGNPSTTGVDDGVGGMVPLIIGGRRYGDRNIYSSSSNSPSRVGTAVRW